MNYSNLLPRPVKEIMIDALEELVQAWKIKLLHIDESNVSKDANLLRENISNLEKLIGDLRK